MSKYIFSPKSIDVDEPKVFDVPQKSIVIVDNLHFEENLVSRIEVKKIKQYPDTIFIALYCGNIQIGEAVSKTPYMLDIENIGNVQIYYSLKPATKLNKEE